MKNYKIIIKKYQEWKPREAKKMFEHYATMEDIWATKENYIVSMSLINDQGEIINEYKGLPEKTLHKRGN